MVHLRENKGMLLITTFMVTTVIFVLSGAYIAGTITQNNAVRRQNDSLAAFYNAGRGIEYAFVEAQNSGYAWVTHQVATTDLDGNGQIDDLVKVASPPAPTLQVEGATPTIDSDGNYYIASVGLKLKAYYDPNKANEIIVLSQATAGITSHIIKYRIDTRSLFDYFYYYPTSRGFMETYLDGGGVGRIYVNGDIGLFTVDFKNIKELSTNKNGSISVYSWGYAAPGSLDALVSGMDGKAPLLSLPLYLGTDGQYYVKQNAEFYEYKYSDSYPYPYGWGASFPHNFWWTVSPYFSSPGKINDVTLPRTLGQSWEWKKYYDFEGGGAEQPVRFYDAQGRQGSEITVNWKDWQGKVYTGNYWDYLSWKYGVNYFDPAFWQTKTYERKSVSVNYLNTGQQATAWPKWLKEDENGKKLDGIVKEKSTGAYDMVLPNISTYYALSARQDGLYIEYDADGNFKKYCLNGNCSGNLPGWIKNVTFFNTFRTKIVSGQPQPENVLELNINKLKQSEKINNGIIYVLRKNIRLTEAAALPENGLTVVSTYNVYIKGDYNITNKQPASIITNSIVYFLSENFNDPDYLPAPSQPRDCDAEETYLNKSNFVPTDPEKMQALELECEGVFGLSSGFDIVNSPPSDYNELRKRIRQYYYLDHDSIMPNKSKEGPTEINTAIASPYDISFGYGDTYYNQLERWSNATLKVSGAFIKLGDSWINDDSDNPIRDVPKIYNSWVGRAGSEDITQQTNRTSLRRSSSIAGGLGVGLRYDTQFETQKPPGDFRGSSTSWWQEVSDFDHHTT